MFEPDEGNHRMTLTTENHRACAIGINSHESPASNVSSNRDRSDELKDVEGLRGLHHQPRVFRLVVPFNSTEQLSCFPWCASWLLPLIVNFVVHDVFVHIQGIE